MSVCKRLCYFSTPSGECKKAENVPCPLEVPMPVVKGKWEEQWEHDFETGEDVVTGFCCSGCGMYYIEKHNYCPNCGAKMGE